MSPRLSSTDSDDGCSDIMYVGSHSLVITNHVSAYQDEMFRHKDNTLPTVSMSN